MVVTVIPGLDCGHEGTRKYLAEERIRELGDWFSCRLRVRENCCGPRVVVGCLLVANCRFVVQVGRPRGVVTFKPQSGMQLTA